MSKTLKKSMVLIIVALGIVFTIGTTVEAGTRVDLTWYTINAVVEKGQVYNEKYVDHIEGLTYVLNEELDELPNGLSLTNDGRISGTVSETQTHETYDIEIFVYKGEEYVGYYYEMFVVVDDLSEVEWVDFDNLFMEDVTVYEEYDYDEIHTKDGFLVYNPAIASYINYNPQTKTYNVTLTQNFEMDDVGNYVELVFKDSEHNKFVQYEMIENVGFMPFSSYFIKLAEYEYVHNDEFLYSAYFYAEVDKEYTGENRHIKVKVSNPNDSSQYRYIQFHIADSNNVFVAFETNGGNSIASMEKSIGDTITLPTEPTKEGWIFEGWYIDPSLETEFDESMELTTNVVLYAKWTNDYKFVEGDGFEYTLNKDENARFKINANFDLLDKVFVDDEEIDNTSYTKEKGSTIITLLKEYLSTLSVGEHTLNVTYTDSSSVETEFTIVKEEEKDVTPKTGSTNYIGIITIVSVLLGTGAIALKKKKAY